MFLRTKRSLVVLLCCFASTVSTSLLHAETTKAEEEEAQQLYSRANDYVAHIGETGFSYAYVQFYWKRAQSNLDRILRVYPQTLPGRQLRSNELKIGPYELAYFKERVLPRLEEKKTAAFDAVYCAIFLYNLDQKRQDAERTAAMESIVEILCRQNRWNEALAFPVLDRQRILLHATVFRVAARFNEQKVMKELLAKATPAEKAIYWPIQGEALALNGVPRNEIDRFIRDHPEAEVKQAIFSGMVSREIDIQRATTLHLSIKDSIPKTHYSVSKLAVRDDIDAVAQHYFPQPSPEVEALLGRYRAALGRKPQPEATLDEHLAYLDYLATVEKFDEIAPYLNATRLSSTDRRAAELKGIELLAGHSRQVDEGAAHAIGAFRKNEPGDAVTLADFRGQMNATDGHLTVREHTFSDLKMKDPCVVAQLILEWSLTPNRAIRGAAPWDSIVQNFLPGYDNLPLPKSKAVQDASSASKPF